MRVHCPPVHSQQANWKQVGRQKTEASRALPMISGGTPTAEKPRQMPRTGSPRRCASRLVISSDAAAPSLTCVRVQITGLVHVLKTT